MMKIRLLGHRTLEEMEGWGVGRVEGWKNEAFQIPIETLKAVLDLEGGGPPSAALPDESFLGGRLGDPALP